MRLLLEISRKAITNAVDNNGDTPLHLAARSGNAVAAIVMLHTDAKLALNTVNRAGFTPLLEAAFWAEMQGPVLRAVEALSADFTLMQR